MKFIFPLCLGLLWAAALSAQCSPDVTPPLLVPKTNYSVALGGPNCTAVIRPAYLLESFSDNCSVNGDIQLGFRRLGTGYGFPFPPTSQEMALTPTDLPGPVLIEVWAKDKAGNTALSFVQVGLQNPTGCTFSLLPDAVRTAIGEVNWMVVTQSSAGSDTVFTINNQATFPQELFDSPNQDNIVTVWPAKDDDPLNGVSTFDLVMIIRHYLGVQTFVHTVQAIAADIDRNNLVTPNDFSELRKLILGIYSEFPDNVSWRFISGDYNFPLPTNPIAGPIPESVTFDRHRISPLPDFVAVKVGDVNGNAVTSTLVGVEDRANAALSLPDMRMEPGQRVSVPVRLSEFGQLEGLQGVFTFDPTVMDVAALRPGSLPGFSSENYFQREPGVLALSWAMPTLGPIPSGEPMFFLEITAHKPLVLSEALWLRPGRLRAEAYDMTGRIADLDLRFDPLPLPKTDEILPAYPNPTTGDFFVPVRLATDGQTTIEVFDTQGRLVYSKGNDLPAGEHRLRVPAGDWNAVGVYWYRITAGAVTAEHGRIQVGHK
ncbi:MAG: T9SS type A sorting domain-containing protein [Saprospiraceae bacterium]